VGVVISPEYRHRGYGLDALNTLESYACKVLRLNQLWCSVTDDNLASRQLFLRAGFTECGRRKQWILTADGALDEILYQKILQ
jgi:diamine N-acetyltransferase